MIDDDPVVRCTVPLPKHISDLLVTPEALTAIEDYIHARMIEHLQRALWPQAFDIPQKPQHDP